MSECVFCKIVRGEIPAKLLYEDGEVVAFHDIHPIARVHFLIIPKLHLSSLLDCHIVHQALLGRMLLLTHKLALESGLDGYRTMINTGESGGQEVFHLHMHVFGGDKKLPKT